MVYVWYGLDEGFGFCEFFCCVVQQVDVWIGMLDDFVVEFEYEVQYVVCCWVLWVEVECVVFDFCYDVFLMFQIVIVIFVDYVWCDFVWFDCYWLVYDLFFFWVVMYFDVV